MKALDIKDYKLSIQKSSRISNSAYKVDFKQSCVVDGISKDLEFSGIFKLVENKYKFSDLDFGEISTEHFLIKYLPSLKTQAENISQIVDKAYENVKKIYGKAPEDKTTIKLYDDNQVFSWFIKPSINFDMEGWYEFPESIKINLSFTKDRLIDPSRYLRIISHELTHRISIEESSNNMPYWMAEGLAVLVENSGDTRISKPVKKISELEKVNLEKLSKPDEISEYYEESYINVSLFIKKFGMDSLHDVLSELGKYPLQEKTGGQSIDENNDKFHKVIESYLSLTVDQLDERLGIDD
jgi:hypothetical protein